jgi:hypothetical protein
VRDRLLADSDHVHPLSSLPGSGRSTPPRGSRHIAERANGVHSRSGAPLPPSGESCVGRFGPKRRRPIRPRASRSRDSPDATPACLTRTGVAGGPRGPFRTLTSVGEVPLVTDALDPTVRRGSWNGRGADADDPLGQGAGVPGRRRDGAEFALRPLHRDVAADVDLLDLGLSCAMTRPAATGGGSGASRGTTPGRSMTVTAAALGMLAALRLGDALAVAPRIGADSACGTTSDGTRRIV